MPKSNPSLKKNTIYIEILFLQKKHYSSLLGRLLRANEEARNGNSDVRLTIFRISIFLDTSIGWVMVAILALLFVSILPLLFDVGVLAFWVCCASTELQF